METPQPKIVNFAYRAPVVLAMFLTGLYGIIVYIDYTNNSTLVTNAAFVVMASLSAISFSYARTKEAEKISNRLTFAGERLLHGAILLIVTSVIKFILFKINETYPLEELNTAFKILFWSVLALGGMIFSNGLLFAHTGLRILNDIMVLRMTRERDWDDLY